MLWPTATAGRLTLSAARFGARMVLRTVGRLVGAETLADTVEFLAAFEGMYAGFRQRAGRVMELLASPECAFVVVASPTPPSLAEAGLFLDRLDAGAMRAAATVVNRVHPPVEPLPPGAAEAAVRLSSGAPTERAVAAILREAERERARTLLEGAEVARFVAAHRGVRLAMVPETAEDVHDVPGLRRIAAHLFEAPPS
jgi:anion-transporting  ArsA/GET3 family ATPase